MIRNRAQCAHATAYTCTQTSLSTCLGRTLLRIPCVIASYLLRTLQGEGDTWVEWKEDAHLLTAECLPVPAQQQILAPLEAGGHYFKISRPGWQLQPEVYQLRVSVTHDLLTGTAARRDAARAEVEHLKLDKVLVCCRPLR